MIFKRKMFIGTACRCLLPPPLFYDFTKFILNRSVRDVGKNFTAAVSDCFVHTSSDEISLCNLLTGDAYN
jgi:hypothetical protein